MNYLYALIDKEAKSRYSVVVTSDLSGFDNKRVSFNAVLDTGCQRTKLSALLTGWSDVGSYLEKDIRNYRDGKLKPVPSYGVSDDRQGLDMDNLSDKDLRSNKIICYPHKLSSFSINGYSLEGMFDCKVSYLHTSDSLIGMNILRKLEIHMGYSHKAKTNVLIACQRRRLNRDFFIALHSHFGLLPSRDRLCILNNK